MNATTLNPLPSQTPPKSLGLKLSRLSTRIERSSSSNPNIKHSFDEFTHVDTGIRCMDMRGRGVNGSTSSDQTVFVFGGDNGDLYIRSSGKEQKQVTVVSKPGDKWSGVECVTFQPNTRREVVFVGTNEGQGSDGGKIVAVSTLTATILYRLEGHKKTVTGIAATSDGSKIISVSYDKTAKIWDVKNRNRPTLIKDIVEKDDLYIRSVAISPNSEVFCLGGGDSRTGFIHVHDMKEPYNPLHEFKGHKETVRCLTFSRDNKTLFSGSSAKTIKVWNYTLTPPGNSESSTSVSGELRKTLVGHTGFVNCLSESPCSKFLCSGSDDCTARIWDILAGVELRELKVTGEKCAVNGVCYMDHHDVKTASGDGQIGVFNLSAESRPDLKFIGHKGEVSSLSISKDGTKFASGSLDNTVRVWDATGKKDRNFVTLSGHTEYIICVAISNDAKLVLSGSYDCTIIIWDLESTQNEKMNQIKFENRVYDVEFAIDELSFFAGGRRGHLRRYTVATGELLMEFKGHTDRVSSLAVSLDGKHLVTGSWDKNIIVWRLAEEENQSAEVKTGEIVRRLEGHSDYVKSITLVEDKILSGSADNSAKVWDFTSGELLHTFKGHMGAVNSVAVHPSKDFIATGSFDNSWKLWNFHPPFNLLYTSTDTHKDHINAVVFTPRGDNLMSGADDKTISVADIAPHLHTLPSSLHSKTFARDCKGSEDAHRFNWAETDTMRIIQHRPVAPFEPHYNADTNNNADDMQQTQQTLIQKASEAGAARFLQECLFVSDDGTKDEEIKGKMRGIVGYKPVGFRSRQELSILSCLMRDLKNRTPLTLATNAKGGGGPAVKVILDCYALLFSQNFAQPFPNYDINLDKHPTTLFPLEEFIETLNRFPALALNFLGDLNLISPEDPSVQKHVDEHVIGPSKRYIRGSSERMPKEFWHNALNEKCESEEDSSAIDDVGVDVESSAIDDVYVEVESQRFKRKMPPTRKKKMKPVTAKFVPIYKIAAADSEFLKSVVKACILLKKYNVFENEVVQTVVEHKWKKYVRRMFFYNFFLYALMVGLLTVDALVYRSAISSDAVTDKIVGLVPMIGVICIWFRFTFHEWAQFQLSDSFYSHTADFWNILDVLSLYSIFCTYTFRLLEGVFGTVSAAEVARQSPETLYYWSTLTMSCSLPLAYLNILYYLQGFHESGRLVRMIIGIIKGIRVFLGLLGICMVGFSAGFFVLFEAEKDNNPLMRLFQSYTLMLGDFDIDDFHQSLSYISIAILFITFTVFINIIMLNLLIAIMGDIFDRIQENARAEFMFARAGIVLEFEETLSDDQKKNPEWFPEWLQVLVPTLQDSSLDNEWVGRLKSLKNTVTEAKLDVKEKLHQSERRRQISERQRIESEERSRKSERRLDVEISRLNAKLDEETERRREMERKTEELLKSICDKLDN
ncbi:hypothetical protein TrVE_jg9613 [Triparma verrucosa]|uniref:Ion transport domain-containing protein n=1 Tax=Triparma verrucosa TaxID=1606542 RepID=A0A9W7KTL8_9STRA|nr:hypothetical protein TrVE_jg9613 [Triparma verrucosa]